MTQPARIAQRVMLSDRVLDADNTRVLPFNRDRCRWSSVRASESRCASPATYAARRHETDGIPIDRALTDDGLHAEGKTTIRQRDFGIEPVTAGAGTERVKDEVEIVFDVTARRP